MQWGLHIVCLSSNKPIFVVKINAYVRHLISSLFTFQNQGKPGHEVQSSTLELINGLVSLVHQQWMPEDVAQEAMEVYQILFFLEKNFVTLYS